MSQSDKKPAMLPSIQIGAPPALKPDADASSWRRWRKLFDAYTVMARLKERTPEEQVATLITALGIDAFDILESLPFKDEAEKKDLDRTLGYLELHFGGKENVIYERFKFNTRQRAEDETFHHYISELRQMSRTCSFNSITPDEILRDRIVCGINDQTLTKTLLQKKNLSLEDCIEHCRSSEQATFQARGIDHAKPARTTEASTERSECFAVSTRNYTAASKLKETLTCKYCGRRHERGSCPAYGQECRNCGKKNHFASVCRSKKLHQINEESEASPGTDGRGNEQQGECQDVRNVNVYMLSPQAPTSIYTTLHVEGHPVQFQVDTGASCNIIKEDDVRKILPNLEVLSTRNRLRTYDGAIIKPKGVCMLMVKNSRTGKQQKLECMIVSEAPVSLLGCRACQEMGLISIHTDRMITANRVDESHLGSRAIEDWRAEFADVFDGEMGELAGPEHFEVDGTVPPVKMPVRRVPLAVSDRLEGELQRLLELGVIEEVGYPTEWVSGLVVAEKKNGKLRVCIDPQPLNKALKRSIYPMPTMEEVLPKLAKARVFTVCDIKNGFWHVKLDEASSVLTTFATPFGRFKWKRLPFGVSVAPEIFQRKLDESVTDLPCVERIVDDLIVWGEGETEEEADVNHDVNLRRLLERARKSNLKLNAEKLVYKKKEIKFAGYILTDEGHKPDQIKVTAIKNMEPPQDVAGVRRFLGMTNYFAKYLKNLSQMTEPLRLLTTKDTVWQWSHDEQEAFTAIKQALVSAPLLSYFDRNKPAVVQCDASQYALGAVLLQEGRPVSYASRTLTQAEQNYAQIEKELLSVVFGMERFDTYTYGRHMVVESDHKPLQTIVRKPVTSAPKRLQRMLMQLQRYSFELIYRPGRLMVIADTLSRAPDTTGSTSTALQQEFETVCSIVSAGISDPLFIKLKEETRKDKTLMEVSGLIQKGWPADKRNVTPEVAPYFNIQEELVVEDGVVLKGDRCVIPSSLRKEVLEELHRPHLGVESTLRRARETVYWPLITSQIRDYVGRCDTCRTFEPRQQKQPLISHEVINEVWAKVGVDLFSFEDRNYLMTVDYFTNFWEVDNLRQDTTSYNVIYHLKRHFARYGIPMKLISDNGPQFVSQEFKAFLKEWGVEHETTSPYHPQANGKVESAVKMAKTLLIKSKHSGTDVWRAVLDYRNTPTQAMENSPAERMFCRRTRTLLPMKPEKRQQRPVDNEKLTERILINQQHQRSTYDRGSKELRDLRSGEKVRIQIQGRWLSATVQQRAGSRSRSYTVRLEDGRYFRRNRRDIRTSHTSQDLEERRVGIDQKQTVTLIPAADSTAPGQEQQDALPAPIIQTRSGRTVNKPTWLKDYHCS